jgi:type I restriction enzyme S subunit
MLYALQAPSFIKQYSAVMAQSTRFQVPITTQRKLSLVIPTLAEQTLIANALSDADALISSLEQLIAKKKLIKQGAMQQLLKPKKGWEVKKLGEVAFINMGQSPLSVYYNREGNGLPLVQGNADIENRKTIIRSYTSVITKRGRIGDIIMSVRAPVGEIAKATFDCCLGRGVCAISYKNEYVYHYLIYFEKSWAKLSTGSTFDSVNSKQVKELEIDIPTSEDEQIEIATVLSDMDTEITTLETKLDKYRKIKQGMMQNLLTGKIRLV